MRTGYIRFRPSRLPDLGSDALFFSFTAERYVCPRLALFTLSPFCRAFIAECYSSLSQLLTLYTRESPRCIFSSPWKDEKKRVE